MSATTFKIESPLLDELKKICPKEKSLSAFLRSALEQLVRKQSLAKALKDYQDFMLTHKKEAEDLNEWENADLVAPPKSRKKQ